MSQIPTTISPDAILYQEEHITDNDGASVTVTTSIFFVIALTAVVLRFIARSKIYHGWRIDDYMIAVALLLAAGLWSLGLLCVRFGMGQHTLAVGLPNIVDNLKALFALQIVYNAAHVAVKTSILLLYKSIFTLNIRPFKIAWYCVLAYVISCGIVGISITLAQCTPISYGWEAPLGAQGHCVDLIADEIGSGVFIVVADVALLIMPMPILWTLKIKLSQKLQLVGVFALGLLAIIASAVRISYLTKVSSSIDFTFVGVNPLIWSILEVDLGITCACIPTLRPLFNKGKGHSSKGNSHSPAGTWSTGTPRTSTLVGIAKSFFSKFGSKSTVRSWPGHISRHAGYSKDEHEMFRPNAKAGVELQQV